MKVFYTAEKPPVKYKDILVGDKVIDNDGNFFMKIKENPDISQEDILNLVSGEILDRKTLDDKIFFIPKIPIDFYEKVHWFNEFHYVAKRYPNTPVFFYEIEGLEGRVFYYKRDYYIVVDDMCAYNLKTGYYTYIGSDELVIPADDNYFIKN